MKWNIGNKIGGLIIFAIASFFVLGTWSYITIGNFIESVEWSTHTHEVMETNELVVSYLKDAETGQRGYIITGDMEYLEPYTNSKEKVYKTLDYLKELTSDNPIQQQRLITYKTLIDEEYEELQETIDIRTQLGFEAAQKFVMSNKGKSIMDNFRKISSDFEEEEMALLVMRDEQMYSNATLTNYVIIIGSLLAALILGIIGYLVVRNIKTPLDRLTKIASLIAKGDLTVDVQIDNDDEVGELANSFKLMQKNLRNQLQEITEGVNVLSSSSSEIMAMVSQLASTSAETATSVSETSTTVEEVKQTAEISNQKASEVSESAQKISLISQDGNRSVRETIEGMDKIKQQMEHIAGIVIQLSDKSQAIGEIASSVNDLSEQSNLLAVNASIEAAKAGDHGKGFAVVAQKIDNLAERSKEATVQIRSILADIQKDISSAVMATEQGGKVIDEGLSLSNTANEVITTLAAGIEEASQSSLQIAASSQQQVVGMDQITSAIDNIREASLQASSSTKQTEESISELNGLGNKLMRILKMYKL